jgi:hypothetical protein
MFIKSEFHGQVLYRSMGCFCLPTLYLYRDRWNVVTSTYQAGTAGSYKVITDDTEMRQCVCVYLAYRKMSLSVDIDIVCYFNMNKGLPILIRINR